MILGNTIARLVTRLQGDGDGLILGTLLEPGVLKPDTVYNLKKCLLTGNIFLEEVGESIVGCGMTGYNWAFEYSLLLDRLQPYIFMSKKEYKLKIEDPE